MRIFVTGATGFIGSNFLNLALSEGHKILALRRSEKSIPRVPLKIQPNWLTKQLDEITNFDLEGIDCIVHLAAHSMVPPYDSIENCYYWNVMAPIRLFDEAIKAGIKKFVVAGSCFEYGLSGEDYDFIPVTAPLRPTLTYAASKAAASIAFSQLAIEKCLDITYLRIFHVFGEGEDESRLWPSLRKAAELGLDFPMTNGEQVRDFIHVDQVVDHLLSHCIQKTSQIMRFEILNLGSGNPQSIADFAQFWWNKWKAEGNLLLGQIPYRQGEVFRYVPLV
ncbi:NAD-dependent epimerase/dehydratase family protein [Algoriphagus formosus]|uniref:NAD(P)-dependent oxidoreductase n=1 Tax=Algoriphagus formosus TaxID=2007308 RepID=A0A4V3AQA6_9BACT|nr:NAD(P)-dependent oxidoreductase [Algoriphagus aquimaris]TDK42037.1 NAD(P)-dependent oxidoreductase [Algoriphagus aquimaris]